MMLSYLLFLSLSSVLLKKSILFCSADDLVYESPKVRPEFDFRKFFFKTPEVQNSTATPKPKFHHPNSEIPPRIAELSHRLKNIFNLLTATPDLEFFEDIIPDIESLDFLQERQNVMDVYNGIFGVLTNVSPEMIVSDFVKFLDKSLSSSSSTSRSPTKNGGKFLDFEEGERKSLDAFFDDLDNLMVNQELISSRSFNPWMPFFIPQIYSSKNESRTDAPEIVTLSDDYELETTENATTASTLQ